MSFTNINYEEPYATSYKSVDLSYRSQDTKIVFDSGDFVKDWYDCRKHIIFSESDGPHGNSSSVDHFIMDGAPFDSMYLKFDENKLPHLSKESDGIEFFVKEGTTPTWLELRELCGDPKISEPK